MLGRRILACIQCGAALLELKCKLKCPRCGYFEDCSDGGTNIAQETYLKSSNKKLQVVDPNKPINQNRFPYSI